MGCGPAAARVLQRLPRFLQDLERGNDRREHLYVTAGRADDLPICGVESHQTLWAHGAEPRKVPGIEFVTSNHANVAGNCCAASTCRRRHCRSGSRSARPRSPSWPPAALIIGTQIAACDDLLITITAATPRPAQLRLCAAAVRRRIAPAIDAHVPDDGYFDDVHGSAPYKRYLMYHFTEQIRVELVPGARP